MMRKLTFRAFGLATMISLTVVPSVVMATAFDISRRQHATHLTNLVNRLLSYRNEIASETASTLSLQFMVAGEAAGTEERRTKTFDNLSESSTRAAMGGDGFLTAEQYADAFRSNDDKDFGKLLGSLSFTGVPKEFERLRDNISFGFEAAAGTDMEALAKKIDAMEALGMDVPTEAALSPDELTKAAEQLPTLTLINSVFNNAIAMRSKSSRSSYSTLELMDIMAKNRFFSNRWVTELNRKGLDSNVRELNYQLATQNYLLYEQWRQGERIELLLATMLSKQGDITKQAEALQQQIDPDAANNLPTLGY